MFALIAVYFPTTWESEEAADELNDLLTLVVDSFPRNAVVIIGGDFNAMVGGLQAGDDANILGCWGHGPRLIAWATGHGLQFSSRMANHARVADSWTLPINGWIQGSNRFHFDIIMSGCTLCMERQQDSSWVGSSMCPLQTRISKSAAILATSKTQLPQTLATLQRHRWRTFKFSCQSVTDAAGFDGPGLFLPAWKNVCKMLHWRLM